MYLVSDDRYEDVTLYSVQDCIEHGVMDTVASRNWMSDAELFEALRKHWTGNVRYDIGASLRTFAHVCAEQYRQGRLG